AQNYRVMSLYRSAKLTSQMIQSVHLYWRLPFCPKQKQLSRFHYYRFPQQNFLNPHNRHNRQIKLKKKTNPTKKQAQIVIPN
ncbi:hypothetical protein ACVGWG_06785, partial [Enterobacter asburiae]